MDNLNKFNTEIKGFVNNTLNYKYSYNSIGNLFFTDSGSVFNQTYLFVSESQLQYNDNNMSQIYDLNFEEFVDVLPATQSVPVDFSGLVDQLNQQVLSLQDQLSLATTDSNALSNLTSQVDADRGVIVQLRIQLGEGSTDSDFSQTFPYLPLSSSVSSSVSSKPIISGSISSSSVSSSINPLAIFDTDGNLFLDKKEIVEMAQQYTIGNPVLINVISSGSSETGKVLAKNRKLTADGIQYLVDKFYGFEEKNYTINDILKKLDSDGNGLLDKKELKLNNPLFVQFNVDGQKGLSDKEMASLIAAILT